MRTCPAPGWGISRSTMSKPAFGLEICATFMVTTPVFVATFTAVMVPPGNPRLKVEERWDDRVALACEPPPTLAKARVFLYDQDSRRPQPRSMPRFDFL